MKTNIQMATNAEEKLLFGDLSYKINGLLFGVHNEKGRFAREKQYADLLEERLKGLQTPFVRELVVGDSGNIIDFLIDNSIVLELKAKPFLPLEDYEQVQRYLHATNLRLGLLVNFRTKYLQIKRILRQS